MAFIKFELPKLTFDREKLQEKAKNFIGPSATRVFSDVAGRVVASVFIPALFGFLAGFAANIYFHDFQEKVNRFNLQFPIPQQQKELFQGVSPYISPTSQEQAVIQVVKQSSNAVVSVVASKDVPVFEQYYVNPFQGSPFEEFFKGFEFQIPQQRQKGTEKREISAGTGFIISEDGLILTNRHVVSIEGAEYTIYTNDGRKFQAEVLAKDPVQDLAILKVKGLSLLPTLKLGDSSNLQIGQSVIAIGNALGEFRNTVSVGVISGLGRTITASGGGTTETLEDVIQTDAAINEGNSGGPLLNLRGEVIGINTAIVSGAQNIGFAIPINLAKRDIEQVKTRGKISYAYLGVWYTIITPELQKALNLPVDYGAWIGRDERGNQTTEAVVPGSPADRAGIWRNDIILEFDGKKITKDNSLTKIIKQYMPGDRIQLKLLREGKEMVVTVSLGERSE
jgi:serine protease Do